MIGATPRTLGRLPVGTRLGLMLLAEVLLVVLVRSLAGAAAATAAVVVAYAVARIPVARAWSALRAPEPKMVAALFCSTRRKYFVKTSMPFVSTS